MAGIIDFVEAPKVNPYTDAVKALVEAGDGKGFEIVTETKDSGKASLAFRKAANEAGKTARLRINEADAELGTTRLVFTLTHKHAARRGASETGAESVTEAAPKTSKGK